MAEKVAEVTGGDLFELVPTEPYTADDLNYHNSSCRANQEQNDPAARPAIRNLVDNLDSYDTVFIGYPIWHGQPPKIIHTFLESCDLSGKTIATFCTSGGSGHNDSPLRPLAPDATWLTGQRFASADEVQAWIDGLELPTASKQSESSENPSDQMYVQIGATVWTATLEQNASVTQWKELLAQGPLTIDMSDYGGFEKVGRIGADLTQSNRQITTQPGDIILYQGNRITIYYGENSWNFTPLGHLDDVSETELLDVLQAGGGDITVTFSLTNPEGA